jgi:hypothetical protein
MPQSKKKVEQQLLVLPGKKAVTSISPVALLIDGENVAVPDLIAYILVEAGKLGGVTARHVYGNWAAPSMQPWKKYLSHYGLEAMGNRSGPNATDIALVIGAMDLLHQGMKHFCLVAGDSDYVPLVQRLRQEGCTVLVIGTPAASSALKDVSSTFLSTEQLVPQPSPALYASEKSSPNGHPPTMPESALAAMLTKACKIAAQQGQTEWVSLATLGTIVRQHNATFKEIYGKQSLSALVKQCTTYLETRQRQIGKGLVEEVRLRS